MNFGDSTCPACQGVTSGNCGRHSASASKEREIDLTDAALHERLIQTFFAAFQSEASALVQQKALSRADCSALVSSFARIVSDKWIALRDAARAEQRERDAVLADFAHRIRYVFSGIGAYDTTKECLKIADELDRAAVIRAQGDK